MYNVIVFHSHPKLKLSSLRFANPAIFIIPPPSYPKNHTNYMHNII